MLPRPDLVEGRAKPYFRLAQHGGAGLGKLKRETLSRTVPNVSVARSLTGCKTIPQKNTQGGQSMDARDPMDTRFLAVVVVAMALMLALGYAIYP